MPRLRDAPVLALSFGAEFSTVERWRYAIKPASWPKLLVPTVLGQLLGILAAGGVSLPALTLGLLFTLCNGAAIVLLNDWGDAEVDVLKRRMFPDGCSPKTLPDGVLPAPALLVVGVTAAAAAVAVAFLLGAWLERAWLGAAGALCILVFVAYSLPPVRLNYRGGGEALEAIGVGALLPWLHAYAQSGQLWSPTWWVLAGFVGLSLASALASGLSDEESDAAGGKRTVATLAGNRFTRRMGEALVLLAAMSWVVAAWRVPALSLWAIVPAVVVMLYFWREMVRISPEAVTRAFARQTAYKQALHRAIWFGALTLAAGMLGTAAIGQNS